MGLRTTTDPEQSQDPMPTNVNTASTDPTAPPDVNSLPPEALSLASRLFDEARAGSTATLQQYLEAGIPPNLTNSTGDTLLMLASYHGHSSTVQMLLDKKADPNVLNERGQSPIAGAVFKGFEDVVQALKDGGADVHAGQPSAVDAARMFRRQGCCRILGVQMADTSGSADLPPGLIPGAPPPSQS